MPSEIPHAGLSVKGLLTTGRLGVMRFLPLSYGIDKWACPSNSDGFERQGLANRLTQVVSVAGGLRPKPLRSHGSNRPPRQISF